MARVGRNPNKLISGAAVVVHAPPPVSVGLLTEVRSAEHVAEELQIVHLAVASARFRAGRPVHLAVIDNGSCPAMRRGLADLLADGVLDQLVLAPRLADGDETIARAVLALPGPEVVCADSRLCFLEDWLEPLSIASGDDPGTNVVDAAPDAPGAPGPASPSAATDAPVLLLFAPGARAKLQGPRPTRVAALSQVRSEQTAARPLGARLRPEDATELDGLRRHSPPPEDEPTGSWIWRRRAVQHAAGRVHDLSFRVLYEAGTGERSS